MRAFLYMLCLALLAFGCSPRTQQPIVPGDTDQNLPPSRLSPETSPQLAPMASPRLYHLKSIRGANINSPKAVVFSPSGDKFYINSLEGLKTVILDSETLHELGAIPHNFTEEDAPLFQGEDRIPGYEYFTTPKNGNTNCFGGKPVEFALSHNGKYLWVTYYRKTWDAKATSPSAVAIIDLETGKPARVMPTGTIPKMLTPSPDGQSMAIINWGDNTIGIIDISSANPQDFKYIRQMVDENKLDLARVSGDRDSNCGHCLRGAVFSPDSRYLLVGRMHGGGISVFDARTGEKIGALTGFPATPRHLARDGSTLYVSSNSSGYVSQINLDEALEALQRSPSKTVRLSPKTLFVGKGARTISLSPDGQLLFAVSNQDSRLSMIDRDKWKIVDQIPVSPYGVGLAVSPDGKKLVTTSQGRQGRGGHVIDVYEIKDSSKL